MRRAFARLRWQLTLSHLAATAVTLVCMIAAVVFVGVTWLTSQGGPARPPSQDARLVAQVVGTLVVRGETNGLDAILHALADGGLRPVSANGPNADRRPDFLDPSLRSVAYIVALDSAGNVLASSDPAGASFAPPERQEWLPLAARALANGQAGADLSVTRPGPGPAALGAAPIVDDSGRPIAAVIVARLNTPPSGRTFGLFGAIALFAAATTAVLAGASVFALASASLVAYLLSRRIVGRLERLSTAAGSLAGGNLGVRVDAGPEDEVGLLGRRFNAMAADLQRAMANLSAERDRVSRLLEAQRQLVASVSHELRTPVATIRGYLESLLRRRDGWLAGDQRVDLEVMEREVIRLQRLIDDLFALSRAEVGHLDLTLTAVDIGPLAQQAVATAAPLAWRQRQVQLLADLAPSLPPTWADARRLEQLLDNLLANAVRHTPPGGLVAVVAREDDGEVLLEVKDTGDGIAADDLPHIFERFYRGQDAEGSGAGLGLALVKELTEAMGGTVRAASTPGEGSVFTVRLPAAEEGAGNHHRGRSSGSSNAATAS